MTEALDEALETSSDAALIVAVRGGDTAAYGVLYERHLGAARRAAACLVPTAAEREDLVAEAFTRVLRALRAGHGPVEEFRPYLLVTMRNAAINTSRRNVSVSLYAEVPDLRPDLARDDPVGSRVHAELAADAFASLPERWRMVLWHTEIEGETPATVAPMLGLTPNSVAALAYRAREGLRQAYLQQYLPTVQRRDCKATAGQLPGWVRRNISPHKMRRITAHLDRCPDCRDLAAGLTRINGELRAVLAPVLLGAPFALAYLSASAASSGVAAAAAGASTVSSISVLKAALAAATIATATAITVVPAQPPPGTAAPEQVPGVSVPSQRHRDSVVTGGTGSAPATSTTAPVEPGNGNGNNGTEPPGQAKKETVPPGQAKKETVPPGQAKKETVPPGQAKKEKEPPGQAKKGTEPPGQTKKPKKK